MPKIITVSLSFGAGEQRIELQTGLLENPVFPLHHTPSNLTALLWRGETLHLSCLLVDPSFSDQPDILFAAPSVDSPRRRVSLDPLPDPLAVGTNLLDADAALVVVTSGDAVVLR